MPPTLLCDISNIDFNSKPIYTRDEILEVNPQSFEMQQLDGIIWYDKPRRLILGYKDVSDHEFWIRDHIPGRPIMPGVIMVECAAQLLSFYVRKIFEIDAFIGFASIEYAKFRASVVPGQRLYLLGQLMEFKSRKYSAQVQGLVDGKLIFEAGVSGMKV